jgi:hypothetical protein
MKRTKKKEIEEIKLRLAHLEREENKYNDILSDIHAHQNVLRLKKVELLYGAKVGAVVEWRGQKYRITKVDVKYYHNDDQKPWLEGNPLKKDGTFGIAVRNLYGDWEVAKASMEV